MQRHSEERRQQKRGKACFEMLSRIPIHSIYIFILYLYPSVQKGHSFYFLPVISPMLVCHSVLAVLYLKTKHKKKTPVNWKSWQSTHCYRWQKQEQQVLEKATPAWARWYSTVYPVWLILNCLNNKCVLEEKVSEKIHISGTSIDVLAGRLAAWFTKENWSREGI